MSEPSSFVVKNKQVLLEPKVKAETPEPTKPKTKRSREPKTPAHSADREEDHANGSVSTSATGPGSTPASTNGTNETPPAKPQSRRAGGNGGGGGNSAGTSGNGGGNGSGNNTTNASGSRNVNVKNYGIMRVENVFKPTLFATIAPINQKNYYTEYLKKDEQLLFYRELFNPRKKSRLISSAPTADLSVDRGDDDVDVEDPPLAAAATPMAAAALPPDDDGSTEKQPQGSKTVVLQIGSRNILIGLASSIYPSIVPNVIAHVKSSRHPTTKSESVSKDPATQDSETLFAAAHSAVSKDFKERMRFYKRRILPHSHDLVVSYNSRVEPEVIPDHNDPTRSEWVQPEKHKRYYTGEHALSLSNLDENFHVYYPIQYGAFNEMQYGNAQELLGDLELILKDALREKCDVSLKKLKEYSVVLLIADLYDRTYVSSLVELLLRMGLGKVCILQESMAAVFGAGVSTACVVDVGAQKTSISCVEEGMIIPDSRINLKMGGDDITRALARLLAESKFPISFNLSNTAEWDLMDNLKRKHATFNESDIAVQLYSFYRRYPSDKDTLRYSFKVFDEVMLAPLGLFYPELFTSVAPPERLSCKYSIFPRSSDPYEPWLYNDPVSGAQLNVCLGTLAVEGQSYKNLADLDSSDLKGLLNEEDRDDDFSVKPTNTNSSFRSVVKPQSTSSVQATPPPPGVPLSSTPLGCSNGTAPISDAKSEKPEENVTAARVSQSLDPKKTPWCPLDYAIIESIQQASASTQTQEQFYENLLVVGGGAAKIPGWASVLTDRVGMRRARMTSIKNDGAMNSDDWNIGAMPAPREIDPQFLSWKGGSVFSKLKIANEVYIHPSDWDLLGSRILHYKALFFY